MDGADGRSVAPSGGLATVSSHHERLLNEVEASDGQLGAILKTLYDEGEKGLFLENLAQRIRGHEKDIERMCNKNYQGFIESVSELHKVKSDALKLKRKIQEANHVIQDTGLELMKSAEELHHARLVQRNIVSAMETLNLCIPVLQQYCKLNEQMEGKQYYSALKTLEQLEHTFLPRVRGYIFSDLLIEEIPKLRKSIEDQSRAELTDFLTNVRESSEYIGEVAMHQAHRHSGLELVNDVVALLSGTKMADPDVCAQDLVDFSPVYRCLHIYSVLGKRDQFMEDYRNQRRRQVRLAIKPQGNWKGVMSDYKRYLYGIVGFFVVEDTTLHTSQSLLPHSSKAGEDEGLVTSKIVHEFWQMALAESLAVLRNNCSSCGNYHELLKVKQLVVWFCHTLRGYGFEVEKLYEVLLEIREHYDELLMKAWGESLANIFDSDDYSAIVVYTEEQYQGVQEVFPLKDKELAHAPYPKRFPFSAMVHQAYDQLKQFVVKCTGYADKLNLSQTEIDECVRKSVNILLGRIMSSCLSKLIQKASLSVQQLVQVWINIHYLEVAITDLEHFIAVTTKTDTVAAARLYGAAVFKDASHLTEQQISAKVAVKVGELLDAVHYEWLPREPLAKPTDALSDTVHFLESTFAAVQPLPDELVTSIALQGLKTLQGKMEALLLSDKNPKISLAGFASFDVDLKLCEKFTKSTVSTNRSLQKEPEALDLFVKLRMLINMFTKEEWTEYINNFKDPSAKYSSVPPKMAHTLLYKLRQAEKKKKKGLKLKRPGGRKDEKKLSLKVLKGLMGGEEPPDSSGGDDSPRVATRRPH